MTSSSSAASDLLDTVRRFVHDDVRPYLTAPEAEHSYPATLVSRMGELGLFGVNVAPTYGGLGLGRGAIVDVNRELSIGWQSLSALLGTHLRITLYVQQCGTKSQCEEWLPLLAAGTSQTTHAYHEQGVKELTAFRTKVTENERGELVLSGTKQWCTNARNADRIVVIARMAAESLPEGTVAVVVDPTHAGVRIGDELPRPGVKGISLSAVEFDEYVVDPDVDFIGGRDSRVDDFIARFRTGSSLGFAARAVGAAQAAAYDLGEFLTNRLSNNGSPMNDVVTYRYAQMRTRLHAMESVLSATETGLDDFPMPTAAAHMVKVFCSDELQQVVRDCMMLKGGAGYADESTAMSRIYRDAASLMLIDTPNDILLTRIGAELLSELR
jgi:alkylation response protein AidB-like acyl-CoA dehydrogenase